MYRSGLLFPSPRRARLALFLRNGADAAMTAQFLAIAGDEDKPPKAAREMHRLALQGVNLIGRDANSGAVLLHLAAEIGDVSAVDYLLQRQVPLDDEDASGATPLHRACHRAHLPVVHLLLREARARDDATQKGHFTPQLPWFAADAIARGPAHDPRERRHRVVRGHARRGEQARRADGRAPLFRTRRDRARRAQAGGDARARVRR